MKTLDFITRGHPEEIASIGEKKTSSAVSGEKKKSEKSEVTSGW